MKRLIPTCRVIHGLMVYFGTDITGLSDALKKLTNDLARGEPGVGSDCTNCPWKHPDTCKVCRKEK